MNTNHLISKKDLLAVMGISYGQLYRWKRQRLIPEEWFIKQSAYTGQETFFPREQILSRIQSILELKDKYSLDELARLLSPGTSDTEFSRGELEDFAEIDQELLGGLPKDRKYTYPELGFLSALSALPLSGKERAVLAQKGLDYRGIRDARACVCLFGRRRGLSCILRCGRRHCFRQKRTCSLGTLPLDEEAARLKMKYENKGNERI